MQALYRATTELIEYNIHPGDLLHVIRELPGKRIKIHAYRGTYLDVIVLWERQCIKEGENTMTLDCTSAELDLLHRGLSSYAYIIQEHSRYDTTPEQVATREAKLTAIRALADRTWTLLTESTHGRPATAR